MKVEQKMCWRNGKLIAVLRCVISLFKSPVHIDTQMLKLLDKIAAEWCFLRVDVFGHIGKQWGNMLLLFSLKVEKCPTSPSSHPCAVHTPESRVALDHGNGIYWRFLGNKKLSQLGRSSSWIFYETVKIQVKLGKKNKSSLKIIKSTRVRIPKIQIRVSVG